MFMFVHTLQFMWALIYLLQRLATQNQRLLSLYKSMKQELAAAQKEVKNLQSQLEHYPTEND